MEIDSVQPSGCRARNRRRVAVSLVAALLTTATGCSSSRDGLYGASASEPSVSVAAADTTTDAAPPSGAGADSLPAGTATAPTAAPSATSSADAARLAAAGIQIVASEEEPGDPAHPLRLTDVQANRLAADTTPGSGMLGSELDAIAPVPAGTPPASYLLAAWVVSGTSVSAGTARGWMGDQDWANAPSVKFPLAVVAMFVNEMAADVAQLPPSADGLPTAIDPADTTAPGDPSTSEAPSDDPSQTTASPAGFAPQAASARPALPAASCTAVTGFLSSVFDGLFEALKINPSAGDGGAVDAAASLFASVWNVALGLAKGAIEGLIANLTGPVFAAIRLAVGALGVATVVVSYFKDQTLDVDLQVPQTSQDQYPFAVGDGGDVAGTFVAKGRELSGDWPDALVKCAEVAKAPLPQLIAPGSPATWTVDASDVIVPGPLEGVVGPDNTATLNFVTGRETDDEAQGEAIYGVAYVSVKIPRKEVEDFLSLAKAQIEGVKAQLLSAVPPILRPAFANVIASTIDPTIAQVANSIGGAAGGPLAVEGTSRVTVLHHKSPDTTVPEPQPTEPADDDDGDFCAQYTDMSRWIEANAGGNLAAFGAELTRRLDAMRPSAPDELVGYVDLLRGVYATLASTGDYLGLQDAAGPLGEAARVIGTYCGLG